METVTVVAVIEIIVLTIMIIEVIMETIGHVRRISAIPNMIIEGLQLMIIEDLYHKGSMAGVIIDKQAVSQVALKLTVNRTINAPEINSESCRKDFRDRTNTGNNNLPIIRIEVLTISEVIINVS